MIINVKSMLCTTESFLPFIFIMKCVIKNADRTDEIPAVENNKNPENKVFSIKHSIWKIFTDLHFSAAKE